MVSWSSQERSRNGWSGLETARNDLGTARNDLGTARNGLGTVFTVPRPFLTVGGKNERFFFSTVGTGTVANGT